MSTETLKNRIKNILFTTSEKYDTKVSVKGARSFTDTERATIADVEAYTSMGLSEEEALSISLAGSGHEGAHIKYSEASALKKVLKEARSEGADLDTLNNLCQITEDYRVDSRAADERPGYMDYRRHGAEAAIKLFKDNPSPSKMENEMKAISFLTNGIDLGEQSPRWKEAVDWDKCRETAEELKEIADESMTSSEAIEKVKKLYYKKYHEYDHDPEEEMDDGDGDGDKKESKKSSKGSKGKPSGKSSRSGKSGGKPESSSDDETSDDEEEEDLDDDELDDDSEDDEYDDDEEEDSDDDDDSDDTDDESEGDDDKWDDDAIEEAAKEFGGESKESSKLMGDRAEEKAEKEKESRMSAEERLERMDAEWERSYKSAVGRLYKRIWTEEETKAVEKRLCTGVHAGARLYYGEWKREMLDSGTRNVLEKAIPKAVKLANKLREAMRADKNDNGYLSDSGRVVANRCWRSSTVHDTKLFDKADWDETGGFVVDLVLDASGSQSGRSDAIRQQAFIIARACSLVNIPCRVTMFENIGHYTVLGRLRDFDDKPERDFQCGHYHAGEDNRDGLAILEAWEELKKRQEPNKLMIVLSDGEPCDVSGESVINAHGGCGRYYASKPDPTSDVPLRDVCNAVRHVRKQGAALMGVYVGTSSNTLEKEKIIYGNEFAAIGNNMENFVEIAGKYLIKHIAKLDK